jgi:hypothetical protein
MDTDAAPNHPTTAADSHTDAAPIRHRAGDRCANGNIWCAYCLAYTVCDPAADAGTDLLHQSNGQRQQCRHYYECAAGFLCKGVDAALSG